MISFLFTLCGNLQAINDRHEKIREMANIRRDKLNKAITVYQFLRDMDDEESWIKWVFLV